jgi:hypothetical protein
MSSIAHILDEPLREVGYELRSVKRHRRAITLTITPLAGQVLDLPRIDPSSIVFRRAIISVMGTAKGAMITTIGTYADSTLILASNHVIARDDGMIPGRSIRDAVDWARRVTRIPRSEIVLLIDIEEGTLDSRGATLVSTANELPRDRERAVIEMGGLMRRGLLASACDAEFRVVDDEDIYENPRLRGLLVALAGEREAFRERHT